LKKKTHSQPIIRYTFSMSTRSNELLVHKRLYNWLR